MTRQRVRRLWDRDFAIVDGGLAEDEVVAFVEDLLQRYNELLAERRHLDTLRQLAERRLLEAQKLADSIVQQARDGTPQPPTRTAAPSAAEAGTDSSGPLDTSDHPKIDLVLEAKDADSESDQLSAVLEHLERSEDFSLEGYVWSPSTGWVVTAIHRGRSPIVPRLMAIPEVQGVAEEAGPSEAAPSGPQSDSSRRRLRLWLGTESSSRHPA